MKTLLPFVVSRAQEPSTWRGIVMLLTAFGITLAPELVAAIAATGMSVAGLIGVLTKGS